MPNYPKQIATTTELHHTFKLSGIAIDDRKLDVNIENLEEFRLIFGPQAKLEDRKCCYAVLADLDTHVHLGFFIDHRIDDEEKIRLDDEMVAVFQFRGLYQTESDVYTATFEYVCTMAED